MTVFLHLHLAWMLIFQVSGFLPKLMTPELQAPNVLTLSSISILKNQRIANFFIINIQLADSRGLFWNLKILGMEPYPIFVTNRICGGNLSCGEISVFCTSQMYRNLKFILIYNVEKCWISRFMHFWVEKISSKIVYAEKNEKYRVCMEHNPCRRSML